MRMTNNITFGFYGRASSFSTIFFKINLIATAMIRWWLWWKRQVKENQSQPKEMGQLKCDTTHTDTYTGEIRVNIPIKMEWCAGAICTIQQSAKALLAHTFIVQYFNMPIIMLSHLVATNRQHRRVIPISNFFHSRNEISSSFVRSCDENKILFGANFNDDFYKLQT